jgi:hypothetical protein
LACISESWTNPCDPLVTKNWTIASTKVFTSVPGGVYGLGSRRTLDADFVNPIAIKVSENPTNATVKAGRIALLRVNRVDSRELFTLTTQFNTGVLFADVGIIAVEPRVPNPTRIETELMDEHLTLTVHTTRA